MNNQIKIASGISVLFALWLIISPFVLGMTTASVVAMWDAIIVGIIVLVLSAIRYSNSTTSPALSWISALLGLWMIISPFVLGTSAMMSVLWDFILVGVAFVVFDVWAAVAHRVMA